MMRSKNVSIIQLEGVDGVGKTTLIKNISKFGVRDFAFCDRGDLSDYVYRKKYGGEFTPCVINQNVLIVLLVRNYTEIVDFINKRAKEEQWSKERILKEYDAARLQDKFIDAALELCNDYNILTLDVSGLDETATFEYVMKCIRRYIHHLPVDEEISSWNEMYLKGCNKLGLNFVVRDNQPYINDKPFMSELTNQFGVYETYANKSYPTNLIYSLGYDISEEEINKIPKVYDFAYIINSKINRRPEIYDYYKAWNKNAYDFIISKYVADNYFYAHAKLRLDRVFGNEYLKYLASAKATVYVSRDLAPYEMQTARLYEAILANQLVFVDEGTDPKNKILNQIHDNIKLVQLMRCTPKNICDKYRKIIKDKKLYDKILDNQKNFYNNLIENIRENKF